MKAPRRSTEGQQETALRGELAVIVESSNDAIVGITLDETVTSWNAAAERLFGYTSAEIVGRSMCLIVPEDRLKEAREFREQVLRGGKVDRRDTVRRRKDGSLVEVSVTVSPIRNGRGEITGASKIIRDVTERNQLERAKRDQALHESDRRLRAVIENMSDGLVLSDLTGKLIHWNRAAVEMHGFGSSADWKRQMGDFLKIFELRTLEGELVPMQEWPLSRVFRGEHLSALDLRVRRLDKPWERIFSYSGSTVQDETGGIIAFVTFTDLTVRMHLEETLRKSEALNWDVLNSMLAHIAVLDESGKITMVNDAWRHFAEAEGCACEQPFQRALEGTDYLSLCGIRTEAGAHVRGGLEGLREVMQGRRKTFSCEYACSTEAGEKWFLMNVTPLGEPQHGAVVAHMDITERKRAEATIQHQSRLLDQASEAIVVWDLNGRIAFWNQGAERMYEWREEEAIGRNASELICQDLEMLRIGTEAVMQEGEWHGELEQTAKSGRALIAEARWSLLRGDDGGPSAVLAINLDVTAKKKLETQYLRAQRMESIGTLAGGIAHDLNNMLAPILMSVALLREKLPGAEDQEVLTILEERATQAANMVRQILTFARGFEGRHILVNPKHLVQDVSRIMGDTLVQRVTLETSVSPDVWLIMGDPTQLHQVLLNLCVNARDAMPGGGMLTIVAENQRLDENYAAMHFEAKPGEYVVLSVSDTGTGIPDEIREKIFDPFFTTKELGMGSGLGLATTAAIVKSHRGFINVYSEVGKGSTFKVYLPAQVDAEECAGRDEADMLPRGNGEVVLVVDDEASIREIARQTLEAFGYRVLAASDGTEAVALYAQHRGEIAVVLTDLMMPIMDGVVTIRALRRMNPDLRIIAATGLGTDAQRQAASAVGARHFVQKPFTADAILRLLHEVLGEKPGPGRTG